ncbi:PREDICTED: uncharacterized protein LOC109587261 [Amphimedon queenslandica]|uniref:Death domain-containing protein n=1 Tax=Amphimedon queenslandica TaxID=400682 RepID=A0AAN0JQF9_AMPQE|nr:PREDICTED: uncharacterized protein LOC109587261 [Amphimedon queenslandica]|eukprot:XP_019859058.1 PREDICTED: uncharacterized protein LOC109587261 [Amphimedon queenslandica]
MAKSALFRSVSAKLKDSISSDLVVVSASLYAKSFITTQLHEEMLEGLDSNSNKADKLVNVLQTTLDAHTNPEAYLQEVCSALKEKGQKQIVDVVNELEHTLFISTMQSIDSSSASVPANKLEDTPASNRTQGRLEKWLKEGKVELKLTRINMHGAPGAGKTCSLHLLLNEPPPASTDSTSIACPAVRATRISIDGKNKWERVKIENLLNQLASHLAEAPASSDDVSDCSDKLLLEEPPKKKPTDIEVIKEISNALATGKFQKLSTNWVYFIDSGGQPAYRELLPLFTRAAALNIITIDLTKGLDEKCEFQYHIDQHRYPIDTDLKYSNRDIICSTISSEAMLNPIEIPYVSDMPDHPHYLILGTRKELVTEKKLKEMNESLSEYRANKKVNPQNIHRGLIIFPVNTLLPAGSKEREEASVELCTAISNCAVEMTIELPIRLLTFEISLQREAQKKERSFLTKEEAIKIGRSLRLDSESDIDDALQYLHDVTIILYYPAVLPNIIFVDPKSILDVLSRLIAITSVGHDKLHLIANPPPSVGELNSLKKFGLLKKNIFKKVGKQFFDKDFKSSHMITLLRHLHIIAKVKNREEGDYFFPCALLSYDKLNPAPTEIQPLLIAWKIDNRGTTTLAIPQGLFPLTIVHLLKRKDIVEFAPDPISDPDPDKPETEFYRCHDAMSLRVYNEHLVHIINRYTHIEIRFGGHKESCPLVFKLVTEAIKRSSKDLNVAYDHIFAFNCPQNEQCYCIVKEDKSSTRCTQCQLQCKVLQRGDDSYGCWFSDSQLFSSRKIEEWLKEGEVKLKVTRINMHGAPGAGKTCSQHLLLNEPPPEKLTDSTPIACPAVQATRISIDDENKKWERVNIEDLYKQLASHLEDETENEKMSTEGDEASMSEIDDMSEDDNVSDSSDESLMEESIATEPHTNEPVRNEQTAEKQQTKNIPAENKPIKTEVIQKVTNVQETQKFNTNWVYFIDSGGQPAYRELLPLFTRGAALNIITVDLTKGLDEKCEFHYRLEQHEFPIKTKLEYSNRDIIRSTISSEAMLNPVKISYVSHMPEHSHYLILGTRKDELEKREKLGELNKMNKLLLEEYKDNRKVIPRNKRHIIFPVNTLLPAGSKEREEASASLCKVISNCRVEMTIELPIRLLAFEIALKLEAKKKERSFLTREEVIEIGRSLRLDDESDIDDALEYLHNVTIIFYYQNVLPNFIFTNPKPILDVLSHLIAVTYIDHTDLHLLAEPPPSPDETYNLIKFGLFKEDIFKNIGMKLKVFNKDFQPSHMIALLKHLHIIAEVENREEGDYFFLCALPSCDIDKLNRPPPEIHVQPLLIAWEIDNSGTTTLAIPQGLFPLTIVHLLEKKDTVQFAPGPDSGSDSDSSSDSSSDSGDKTGFYRYNDAISLRIYKEYTIDIINRYTHIEIHLDDHSKEFCLKIRELVTDAIKKSSDDLKYISDLIIDFSYIATGTLPVQPHQDSTTVNPDSDHGAGQLGIEDLDKVLTVLQEAMFGSAEWNNLGLKLGLLGPTTLDVIEDGGGNAHKKLKKTIKAWLRGEDKVTSRTWQTLIDAVKGTRDRAAAERIPKELKFLYDITL